MKTFQVGDHVRVLSVPADLYRDDPISNETATFFEQCIGSVFRVEGFDEHGCLELWTTAKGKPRFEHTGDSMDWHVVWIEPECLELV